jgi:hypothetical protein
VLEARFQKGRYVSRDERKILSEALNVSDHVVKVWFQNRREREKKINKGNEALKANNLGVPHSVMPRNNVVPKYNVVVDTNNAHHIYIVPELPLSSNTLTNVAYVPISPPDSTDAQPDAKLVFEPSLPVLTFDSELVLDF